MAKTDYTGILVRIAEAAGGLSGIAAALSYRLKRREIRNAEANVHDEQSRKDVAQAQSFTQTALALLEPVKEAAAEAEKQVQALRQQVTDLESSVESLKSAMAALSATATAERAELEQRLADLEQRLQAAITERDEALARLAAVEAERDRLRDDNAKLRRQPGAV